MLKVGDRVRIRHGKFKGCVGTIRIIDHHYLPPVVIMPDDIRKCQGVYFYEENLEKIEKPLDKSFGM
jgi:hypothetical protein